MFLFVLLQLFLVADRRERRRHIHRKKGSILGYCPRSSWAFMYISYGSVGFFVLSLISNMPAGITTPATNMSSMFGSNGNNVAGFYSSYELVLPQVCVHVHLKILHFSYTLFLFFFVPILTFYMKIFVFLVMVRQKKKKKKKPFCQMGLKSLQKLLYY